MGEKYKVFVSTHPFGEISPEPIALVEKGNLELIINPYKRKITLEELAEQIVDIDALIAGTEQLSDYILDKAKKLKIISRVGIGLDGIDFEAVKKRGIEVCYTPEAPSLAVAELTLGLLVDLNRQISLTNEKMKNGVWKRRMGGQLDGKTFGIIGLGRVGKLVAKIAQGFSMKIIVNDIEPDYDYAKKYNLEFVSKEEIYKTADFITLHVPLTSKTHRLINKNSLSQMQKHACLINTSRGPVVNEDDLYIALKENKIAGAAIDVYSTEPYVNGKLCELENIILTCHMGSCTRESRFRMEKEAAEDVVRFFKNKPLASPVPESMRISLSRMNIVSVDVNADLHHLERKDSIESTDKEYKDYRRRWVENPNHFITEDFPLCIDIETSNVCNIKCIQPVCGNNCPAGQKEPEDKNSAEHLMKFDMFKKIIDEGVDNKLCSVKLSFRGEPLLNPEIDRMVAYARQKGILDIYFQTNGTLLDENMAKRLINAGLPRITINVTGYKKNLYEKVHGGTVFEDVVNNIEGLKALKEKLSTSHPVVRVQTMLIPELKETLDEYRLFWAGRSDEVTYIDCCSSVGEVTVFPWACPKPWQRMTITWDGKILLCNYGFSEDMVLENIGDSNIKTIWQGKEFHKLREKHKKGVGHEIAMCAKCTFRQSQILKLTNGFEGSFPGA